MLHTENRTENDHTLQSEVLRVHDVITINYVLQNEWLVKFLLESPQL